jgi:hemolysin activation/secretion protein
MKPRPNRFLLCAVLLAVCAPAAPVFAADPIKDVGSEEERLRRPKPLEVPERTVIPIELPPEEELPPSAAEAPPIAVAQVVLEGATILSAKEASALTAPVVNRSATLQELRAVALGITRWYRSRGYVTSRALIPAQAVERGVVKVRVIEGKVGEIRIEGNRHFSTQLIRRYVRLKTGEILQMRRLEEALGSLNAHPDRKVKLVLAPAAQPETTDLILQVTDNLPIHASTTVDTLGTKDTGWIRQSLVFSHGNLTGADDQALVRGIVTEFGGLAGGAFSYLRPITDSGIQATFDVSGVRSHVDEDFKGRLARGEAVTVSPGLIIPVIRRTHWEAELVPGFDFKRIRTREDEVSTSKDDLRVLRLSAAVLGEDGWGRNLFVEEMRFGFPDFLGGSHGEDTAASRAGAGGSFFRWIGSAVRVQKGPWGSSVVTRATGQLTGDRLVSAEQLRLGGAETVRGYPEGTFLADYGYHATVEIRAPLLERLIPGAPNDKAFLNRLGRSLQLVGFWDFGEGFLKGARAAEDKDMRLSGVGCGFRLRPTSESLIQADFGWPLGDRDSEKDRPRIHLICRAGF